MKQEQLDRCQEIIGYRFSDLDLLRMALTHSSIAPSRLESNERMEFLGDVVLGLVICEALYRGHPRFLEGELTKIKSAVVSRQVCGRVARQIGLDECLHVGKGFGPRRSLPGSLTAAVLESVVGAMYLDGGIEPVRRFILEHMAAQIDSVIAEEHARNYKSVL